MTYKQAFNKALDFFMKNRKETEILDSIRILSVFGPTNDYRIVELVVMYDDITSIDNILRCYVVGCAHHGNKIICDKIRYQYDVLSV